MKTNIKNVKSKTKTSQYKTDTTHTIPVFNLSIFFVIYRQEGKTYVVKHALTLKYFSTIYFNLLQNIAIPNGLLVRFNKFYNRPTIKTR